MSAIDKIMDQVQRHVEAAIRADGDWAESADHHARDAACDDLSDQIAAALADARREGAEAMRLRIFAELGVHYGNATETHLAVARELGKIRALPLPGGERQAVLLTDA